MAVRCCDRSYLVNKHVDYNETPRKHTFTIWTYLGSEVLHCFVVHLCLLLRHLHDLLMLLLGCELTGHLTFEAAQHKGPQHSLHPLCQSLHRPFLLQISTHILTHTRLACMCPVCSPSCFHVMCTCIESKHAQAKALRQQIGTTVSGLVQMH
jgi:hypothetical protein